MRRDTSWRVVVAAAFVLCASISSVSAQEEQFNTVPSSVSPTKSVESAFTASVESAFTAPPQPGSILLLDGRSEEGRAALDNFGYIYTKASASELATVNLDAFNIIFISWNPYQEMIDALNTRKADLEEWISKGGGIVVNAEWKSDGVTNPYSFLPVFFDTADTWDHNNGVHIIAPAHPLVEGLTDALLDNWGNSVHGKITAYPPTATVVSEATAPEFGNSPHIVGMCHNRGKIVVAASDPEYHVANNWPSNGPAQLLYNELKWASIPCNQPPVANAGPNQTVVRGQSVCFDGSGSADADNDPLTYAWTLASAPAGSSAALDNTAAVKSCLKTDRIGTYTASLTVNDGRVDSAPSRASAAAVSYADGLELLCPCAGPQGKSKPWSNHGQYVACVTLNAASFLRQRLITGAEMGAAVSAAAKNKCGVPVKK